ncbi:MAG: thioesterase domain-containing protein [Archangium sp.]
MECVAPRTPSEEAIARVWPEVLGVHPIGVHDDFYDLGGESLSSLQLRSRLQEVLQLDLSPAGHARAHDGRPAGRAPGRRWSPALSPRRRQRCSRGGGASLTAAGGAPARRPLSPAALPHPPRGGSVFLYRALARHLDPAQPVYALRAMGLEAGEALDPDIEHMAARYLAELRARQPRGPYLLPPFREVA